MSLPLRDYQVDALTAVASDEGQGYRRVLCAHPTGAGKTVTFSHLIKDRPGRSIVLVHRDELVNQTVDKLSMIAPELTTGVVKAERNETDAQVIVASIQTLARKSRLDQLPEFSTIVCDEAHHATARTWKQALVHMGAFREAENAPLTVGFTATPSRGDGVGLGSVWQKVSHVVGIREMIARGYLVPVTGQVVGTDLSLSKVRKRGGDYTDGDLGTELESSGAIPQIADAYLHYAADRKAVAYTPTVRTAQLLADELDSRGVKAGWVSGATPTEERRDVLHRLHTGEIQVLANCAVLTEGFDEPSVDCVLVARPTKSQTLYIQMVGRGTRLYPGKRDLLVLDITETTNEHDLCTVTDLGISQTGKKRKPKKRGKPGQGYPCALCGLTCGYRAHYCDVCERPLSLEEISEAKERHEKCRAALTKTVNMLASKMRWLKVDDGFCLPAGEDTIVMIPRAEDKWLLATHANKTEVLFEDLTAEYAQGIGEDRARAAGKLAQKSASWLTLPPTQGQLSRLRREGLPENKLDRVTSRGQAADLITRITARRVMRKLKRRYQR